MFPIQLLKARMGTGLALLVVGLAGCSFHHSRGDDSTPMPVASAPPVAAESTAAPDMTATEAAVIEAGAGATTSASVGENRPAPVMNPSAPKSYTVKRQSTH